MRNKEYNIKIAEYILNKCKTENNTPFQVILYNLGILPIDSVNTNVSKEIYEDVRSIILNEQTLLQQEVQKKANINIVTCGNCSAIILHRRDEEIITCFDCNYQSEPCDFPDLNY